MKVNTNAANGDGVVRCSGVRRSEKIVRRKNNREKRKKKKRKRK